MSDGIAIDASRMKLVAAHQPVLGSGEVADDIVDLHGQSVHPIRREV